MLSEPRTYRYSTARLVLLIVLLLVLGIVPFVIIGGINVLYAIPMFGLLGLVMLFSVFTLTRSTTISNDGISTRSLLGESSLNWSEIDSVSGRGNSIKLHNRDGDVTVAPSAHLPGYPEVIEMIGAKRSDLFSPTKYSMLSRNCFNSLLVLSMAILLLGVGIYLYYVTDDSFRSTLFLAFVGLGFLVTVFMTVLYVKLDGTVLTVRYLLNKIVLNINEVHSIGLIVTQSRTGKSYNIMIAGRNRMIRFSGVGPSLPVAYLVLKNWHQGRRS
jgi:hypothetical protein